LPHAPNLAGENNERHIAGRLELNRRTTMNSKIGSNIQTIDIGSPRTESKSDHVRKVFENAPHYLKSRRVDIRFRIEVVRTFADTVNWRRLLDIGCGDGSISLQLLTPASQLTLMDLSASMVALAKKNVPENLAANVEVRNENFIASSFDAEPYDLVVTVGVMAHVDSPDAFLAKIKSLLRPGGNLIIEFTDSHHFVGRLGRLWGSMKEVVAPAKYPTNKLSFSDVTLLFQRHDLRLVSVFRYARIPLPGIDRIMSHKMQYRLAQLLFGGCPNNRNSRFGNEYICLLTTDS
jgi:SAM-dependent methyltransferase